MQRTFWCASIVLVALAGCAYVAACYVEKRPDSFTARCAVMAYNVAADANPVARLGYDVVNYARRHVGSQVVESTCAPSATCTATPVHSFNFAAPGTCADANGLNLIDTQAPMIPHGLEAGLPMPCGDVCPPAGISYPSSYAEASIAIEPGGYEESEELPKTMPPCVEDETTVAPDTMPYCDDDAESKAMYEYWKSLFDDSKPASAPADDGKKMDGVPNDSASEGKQEESEPPVDESDASDLDYHRTHPDTCPGMIVCPYSGRCYPANPEPTTEPTAPAPRLSKKSKDKDKTSKVKQSRSRKMPIRDECGSEDCPAHPEVDTTEFRKSDAHQGAFNPKPM